MHLTQFRWIKIPVCISLSEDGHKAVIGYSTEAISYLDIDNHIISQDYTIDCVPFDIVLGDNGWCYITPSFDQWVNFRQSQPEFRGAGGHSFNRVEHDV